MISACEHVPQTQMCGGVTVQFVQAAEALMPFVAFVE
jgi:hypothetical protein